MYTWGKQKDRYETAFVESNVCGKFPVQRLQAPGEAGDLTFNFLDSTTGALERRNYQMHQTIVRLLKDGNARILANAPVNHRVSFAIICARVRADCDKFGSW